MAHTILFYTCVVLFIGPVLANWSLLVRYLRGGARSSLVPFVGGFFGVGAALLSSDPAVRRYWWVPLIVDPGSIPIVLWTIFGLLRRTGAQRTER